MKVTSADAFRQDGVEAYDGWYDTDKGRAILATELGALRPLIEAFPSPRVEVGVGTGRFAEALGCRFGLDPSLDALRLARTRGLLVSAGVGEAVPFASGRYGAVLMAFTLCFLGDPAAALLEARRLLCEGGGLVIGLLPRGTPWADLYSVRGRAGHPLYRHARFYTVAEVEHLLLDAHLRIVDRRSTLLQPPGLDRYELEEANTTVDEHAGFAAMSAFKSGED